MVAIVVALSLIEVSLTLLSGSGTTHSAVVIAVIVALTGIQLSYFGRRLEFPVGYAVLTVQAVLVLLPMVTFGHTWVGITGFLAGGVLLVLPPAAGWTTFAAVVAVSGVVHVSAGHDLNEAALSVVTTAMVGFVLHGLPWLAELAVKTDALGADLARCAVAEERVRVSRDLHDLLGHGLSAIKLKCELAHRLLPDDPDRARETVHEIVDLTRRSLLDVRSLALGYRLLSLEEAFRSIYTILTSANIAVRMELHHGEVPEPVATVLSAVLREGITNIIRHSDAEQCEIAVRQKEDVVELHIVNDGADHTAFDRCGSGLRNMNERVREVGGTFASRCEQGRFHLHASIPIQP